MSYTLALCILAACTACSPTIPSSSTTHYQIFKAPVVPGTPLPGFEFAVGEDGSVIFPDWLEKAGKHEIKVGNARVQMIAKMNLDNLLRLYQDEDDLRALVTFQSDTFTKGKELKYVFLFQRPNRFALLPDPALGEAPIEMPIMVSDGARLLTYLAIPGAPRHTVVEAPASLQEMQGRFELGMTPAKGVDLVLLAPLLAQGMTTETYLTPYQTVRHTYVWLEGRLDRRLQFLSADGKSAMELWVDGSSKTPWLKRAYLDTDPSGALDPDAPSPRPLAAPGKQLTVFTFDWSNDPLPEDAFAFQPPADSVETKTMFEDLLKMARKDKGGDAPHDSIGKPAPAFELARLGGERTSLQSLLDKHQVLVLDFWATWCLPCVIGLPILEQTAAKYAEQGVGFYAVNYREAEPKVRAFIEKRGFSFPVLLDSDGLVGQAFGVRGIPHTVIIDRQGVVRHVHIGADPKMKERLSAELEALIAEGAVTTPTN